MKLSIKRAAVISAIVATFVGVAGFAGLTAAEANSYVNERCPDHATKKFNVICNGTHNYNDVKGYYNNNAKVRGAYNHAGITSGMINGTSGTLKKATVYKNGDIIIDENLSINGITIAKGTVVGKDAKTFQTQAGTMQHPYEGVFNYGGQNYYQYPVKHSFVNRNGVVLEEKAEIFAWFDNTGKFIAGVIKNCGNPVWTKNPTIPPKPPVIKDIKVCDLKSKQIITIKENAFDKTKHSKDLKDCEEKSIKVCELETKKIVTIKESAFDKTKHSKDLKDCEEKPVEPKKTITVCKIEDKSIITINEDEFDESIHTKDLEKCKEQPVTPTPPTPVTPVTPQELPKTGVEDVIASAVGLGGLVAASMAYIASRKQF